MATRQERATEMATAIWNRHQSLIPEYQKIGVPLTSVMTTTLDEVIAHFLYCDELSNANRVTVDPERWWGKSHAEIESFVEARLKQEKRRSGVKALVKKYGHDQAAEIVLKHSGRHIR